MFITRKSLYYFAVTSTALALMINPCPAGVVFSDDFELPDVEPDYDVKNTSQKADETKWVRAEIGYQAGTGGIIDETENGGKNFTDPKGSQAYGFRYTNSALTTAEGVIGPLKKGVTYTVSFDVFVDGFNDGAAYEVALVTFAKGADRNDVSSAGLEKYTSSILTATEGIAKGNNYETKTLTYTTDGSEYGIGDDVALRIIGFTSSANIDNVTISTSGAGAGPARPVNPVTPADDAYANWIANYPGVGNQDAFDDDADGDGYPNGLENFFGTSPDKQDSKLIANGTDTGNEKTFTFTHPENPTPASNISSAEYQWTTDQKTFHTAGEKVNGTSITFTRSTNTPSSGITTVTGTITGPMPDGIAVNVTVTLNP